MLRWLGAGLILCAGALTSRTILTSNRAARRTRLSLASAFETMEAEVRLLLTPLPTLLRRSYGGEADAFFARVTRALYAADLPTAWRGAAETLPLPPEEREAVARLGTRLCGGEDAVCAALALAASQLRKTHEALEARRAQNERLTTALCLCVGLFLALLLL